LEKIAFLLNAPKQRQQMVETALENGLLAPYGAPQAIAGAISERYFGFYYYEPWAREHPQDARATEVMAQGALLLAPMCAAIRAEALALEAADAAGAAARGLASPGQVAMFERQLAEHGQRSLARSQRSIERQLEKHIEKLNDVRSSGGYTSSIETEIANFRRELEAIRRVLGGM